MTKTYQSQSAKKTQSIAKDLAKVSLPGKPIVLAGPLGSGKTTFVQGFGSYFGIKRMTSPTFTLMKEYQINSELSENTKYRLYHIDLYRLSSPKEAIDLGLKEVWKDNLGWTLIEWPEIIQDQLPKNTIIVKFTNLGQNKRKISITQ